MLILVGVTLETEQLQDFILGKMDENLKISGGSLGQIKIGEKTYEVTAAEGTGPLRFNSDRTAHVFVDTNVAEAKESIEVGNIKIGDNMFAIFIDDPGLWWVYDLSRATTSELPFSVYVATIDDYENLGSASFPVHTSGVYTATTE